MFFDGKTKPQRIVSGSGKKRESDTNTLMDNARKQRELRQLEKQRLVAAIRIQTIIRGYLTRCTFLRFLRDEFDKQNKKIQSLKMLFRSKGSDFQVPIAELSYLVRVLYYFHAASQGDDRNRVMNACHIVIDSLCNQDIKYNILLHDDGFSTGHESSLSIMQKIFIVLCDEIMYNMLFPDSMVDNIHETSMLLSLTSLIDLLQTMISRIGQLSSIQSQVFYKVIIEYVTQNLHHISMINIPSNSVEESYYDGFNRLSALFWSMIDACSNDLPLIASISSGCIRSLIDRYQHFFHHEPWNSLVRNILTIPDLKGYPAILTSLSRVLQSHSSAIINIFSLIRTSSNLSSYPAMTMTYASRSPYHRTLRQRLYHTSIALISSIPSSSSTLPTLPISQSPDQIVVIGNLCHYLLTTNTTSSSDTSSNHPIINQTLKSCLQNQKQGFYDNLLSPIVDILSRIPMVEALYIIETGIHITSQPMDVDYDIDDNDDDDVFADEDDVYHIMSSESIVGVARVEKCIRRIQRSIRRIGSRPHHHVNDAIAIIKFLTHPATLSIFFDLITTHLHPDPQHITNKIIHHILHIYHQILSNLPILNKQEHRHQLASSKSSSSMSMTLLNTMAFASPSNPLSHRIYNFLRSQYQDDMITAAMQNTAIETSSTAMKEDILGVFHVFASMYHHQLSVMDDQEFFDDSKNLAIDDIMRCITWSKQSLYRIFYQHTSTWSIYAIHRSSSIDDACFLSSLQMMIKLFNDLFYRYERRKFTHDHTWYWQSVPMKDFELLPLSPVVSQEFRHIHAKFILTTIPQVIPFQQRLNIFQQLLEADRSASTSSPFMRSSFSLQVRRDHIIEDTYTSIMNEAVDMKKLKGRIQVAFISETGASEAGIDGGGLFKDFIDSFTKKAFDPEYCLFIPTSEHLLTPNPASSLIHEHHLQLYQLFGKILGKALYESILSEPQFAGGFLNILLGRHNQIDDLIYLDREYYTSLMNLKSYAAQGGDMTSLGLTFSTERNDYGITRQVDLIPGGNMIAVTSQNIITYIHRLANYKLNIEIAEQSKAFLSGFRELIPVNWIKMFNPRELQLILSGDKDTINLQDLRQHVVYGGGYADSQPYVHDFWNVLESLTIEEQSAFLKFVTSCPRQPLMGFGHLNPKFGIQKVPTYESDESVARLPSAATCMNLLKLPQYSTTTQLKERLLYAIKSNSGFELS